MRDEEIQNMLDNGKEAKGYDVEPYKELYQALGSLDKDSGLPMNFANKVVGIIAQREVKSSREAYLWFGLGIFAMLITAGIGMWGVSKFVEFPKFSFENSYLPLVFIAMVLIVLIQWLDKKVLKMS